MLKCVVPLSEKVNPVDPAIAAVRLTVEELRLAVTALLAAVIEAGAPVVGSSLGFPLRVIALIQVGGARAAGSRVNLTTRGRSAGDVRGFKNVGYASDCDG